MNHKVNFRVWNKREKKYLYPNGFERLAVYFAASDVDKNNYVFEQFTGALDKNGRWIYDGDKIVCYFQTHKDNWNEMSGKSTGTVKYDETLCQFRVFFKGRHGKNDSVTLEDHHGHVVIVK